jgi:acylglycerol lipase
MYSTVRAAAACLVLSAAGCAGRLPPYGLADQPVKGQVMPPDEIFTMPDGAVLPVRVWLPMTPGPGLDSVGRPPRTVVLALHGFNDSRDAWELPGPVLAAHGIAVFAPDQRGFGAAPGRATWPGVARLVDDAGAMARGLRARYPAARLFVMGESMGGAVALDLAAERNQPPVDGVIALSPAVWGRAEQGLVLAGTLGAANALMPGYHIKGTEIALKIRPTDNHEALLALARDPLTIRQTQVSVLSGLVDLMDSAQAAAPHVHGPVLVAYGGRDQIVPSAAIGKAWSALPPDVRRAVYPNGYHLLMRDLGREAVIGDVIAWIGAPDAFLPSGADVAAAAWATTHHVEASALPSSTLFGAETDP